MSTELIERNRSIAHSYVDGKTMEEIAEEYGISKQRVQQIVNAAGITPSQALLDREARIVSMIEGGLPSCEITAATGANSQTVVAVARRNGLKIAKAINGNAGTGSAWKILADLINTTDKAEDIADRHGVSYQSVAHVKRKAMLAGIPLHPSRKYRKGAGSPRKEPASCG